MANLIVLLAGVVLFFSARNIRVGSLLGAGSEIVPRLMTTAWVILGALIFIVGLRSKEEFGKKINMRPFLITLALLFMYVLMLRAIGFVLVSMAYCFIQMSLFAPEDKRTKKDYVILGAVSVVVPIFINFVFARFFLIILPQGDFIRIPFLF